MKKPVKLKALLLGILVFFLSACKHKNQASIQQSISVRPDIIQQLISVRSDTIQIDNTKDTLVFGSKGTALFFEKRSFQLPNGTVPSGKISIRLKECYSNSDIVRENLTTTADGKLLETRGMINVTAFSNNQVLMLKQGGKFIIRFPRDSSDKEKQMSLFYGNANANGTMGWKLDSLTLVSPVAVSVKKSDTSDSLENEKYNKNFNKKYKAFKNSAITSMDGDELNYYVFSSSKLGWINCDIFWEVSNEKTDYYVKTNPKLKPNIKLVFKQPKSILAGALEGDKYVFKNVPINQEVKIVAITFEGSKPLMAVAETKTGKQVFNKLDYKPFSVSDLESQLNTP